LPIDGLDMGELLWGDANARSPHEALCFYWNRELQGMRIGDWKIHFPHTYRSLTKPPGNDGKGAGYTEEKIGLSLFNLMGRAAYGVFMGAAVISVCALALVGALLTLRFRLVA